MSSSSSDGQVYVFVDEGNKIYVNDTCVHEGVSISSVSYSEDDRKIYFIDSDRVCFWSMDEKKGYYIEELGGFIEKTTYSKLYVTKDFFFILSNFYGETTNCFYRINRYNYDDYECINFSNSYCTILNDYLYYIDESVDDSSNTVTTLYRCLATDFSKVDEHNVYLNDGLCFSALSSDGKRVYASANRDGECVLYSFNEALSIKKGEMVIWDFATSNTIYYLRYIQKEAKVV